MFEMDSLIFFCLSDKPDTGSDRRESERKSTFYDNILLGIYGLVWLLFFVDVVVLLLFNYCALTTNGRLLWLILLT